MPLTTLKDDLLKEFREERIMIKEQIELLDPLATSMRQPAAQRLLSSSTLVLTEFSCYILSVGGLAFIALMHLIYPFKAMNDMLYNSLVRNSIGSTNLFYLIIAVYGFAITIVAFIFIIGRMAREIRLKNAPGAQSHPRYYRATPHAGHVGSSATGHYTGHPHQPGDECGLW
jgi:hypothetical protein